MFYVYQMACLLCFCMGMLTLMSRIPQNSEIKINERIKTMNNQDESVPSNWIAYIGQMVQSEASGTYETTDKYNREVILEYKILNVQSTEFTYTMHGIADIATQAFTDVELQFLQKHQEAMETETLYKQYSSLVKDGEPDWQVIEKKVYSSIHYLYGEMDWSKLNANDVYIFVTIKDKGSDKIIGFNSFFIRPLYPFGTCKVIAMGIIPSEQNRGLGKLLMSSIFKIIKNVQCIFLCTRVTNSKALRAYKFWGFEVDSNPIQEPGHVFNTNYWTFLKYEFEKSEILQKTAADLI